MKLILLVLAFGQRVLSNTEPLDERPFPEKFQFGVASSSYQVEGAWNEDGKGENIWDRLVHSSPGQIRDGTHGDVACDSYHKYKEDVQLVKNLGVDFYRFSLSWSRILPTGYPNEINEKGVDYYNALIDELIKNNIEPMVTIFHWDLPQPLQEIGGWPNQALVEHFVNYADVVFEKFGDRVRKWITVNEPIQICKLSYGDGVLAPGLKSSGIADYMCSYTLLKAHASTYKLYNEKYKPMQKGICGITISSQWYEPLTDSPADIEAAERMFDFDTGIYSNPIFGEGDWPERVKSIVGNLSLDQGFTSSRLPLFTEEEVEYIRGTSDFFGLNAYTTRNVTDMAGYDPKVVSWANDARIDAIIDERWETAASTWLKVVPWGLRKTLKKIKDMYGEIDIYITENGYSDHDKMEDYERTNYHLKYLSACLEAIYDDDVNLVAYTAWSLMDNFEWVNGFSHRFGLHYVDFEDANRTRTPKLSAKKFREIILNNKLPNSTLDVPGFAAINTPTFIIIFILALALVLIK